MALAYIGKVRGYLTGSFTAVPIGTPASNRTVVVACVSGGAASPFTTMTIGGVSATQAVINGSSDGYNSSAIFVLAVPTGTTADIVCASSADEINLYVYTASGLPSSTPSSTANVSHFAVSSAQAVNVPAGGFIIGCSGGWNSSSSATEISTSANVLQTIDEAATYNNSGQAWSAYSGHSAGLSANASYPVSFNENGSLSGYNSAVLAAWSDAPSGPPNQAIIDFGATPGTNIASVAVIGQTGIISGSTVEAWFMASDSTADHNATEHSIFPMAVSLSVTSITPGTGFTITAVTQLRLTGRIACRWVWH